MNFLKHPNLTKALTSFVLLGALLFSSPAFSHFYTHAEKATLTSFVQDSHSHLTPHTPVQHQNAEPQTETELKVEEEDTEKDCHIIVEFFYDLSPAWTTKTACSNRALIRMAGVNGLYILHHSWKSFLI